MPTVKPINKLTFHDRLSRLTFLQAAKLLGEEGRKLIMRGAKYEIDVKEDVHLSGDLLRVTFAGQPICSKCRASDSQSPLPFSSPSAPNQGQPCSSQQ